MEIYLKSLACMVHFPFNQMNELELSYNYAKRHVKLGADLFLQRFEIYGPGVGLYLQTRISGVIFWVLNFENLYFF